MLAAVFKEAGRPWSIETIPDPAPGAAEVVIEVGRCGICGTDLHMTSGSAWDFPAGTVLGHEYAGTIVAIGKGVEGYKVGDIVTALPAAGCGHCDPCRSGNTLLCSEMRGYIGGFGQYLRAPVSGLVKLPATLTLADGALIEPLAVGLHGAGLAGDVAGSRVLVLGAGSVGLSATYWARQLGAGQVVTASRSDRRAQVAVDVGAHAFVALGDDEGDRISEALGGKPDLIFECVGVVGMLGKAVEHVRASGTIVSMGFCTSPDAVVPAIATFKQVRLLFSMAYTVAEFEEVARTLDRGHLEPRKMITEVVGLADLPGTIEGLRTNSRQIKVQVEPWA